MANRHSVSMHFLSLLYQRFSSVELFAKLIHVIATAKRGKWGVVRRPRRGVGTCVEATFRRVPFSKHFSSLACLSFFRVKFSGIAMRVSVVERSSCRRSSSVAAGIDCAPRRGPFQFYAGLRSIIPKALSRGISARGVRLGQLFRGVLYA